MKLFGVRVDGPARRYVECPSCGTADFRYEGLLGKVSRDARTYRSNCRSCGADLDGEKSRDLGAWQQWDTLAAYYLMNGFVWAALWTFLLAIPISITWDYPVRAHVIAAVLAAGAAFGFYRSRLAQVRGEMFQKKRKDGAIDVEAG